MWETAVLNGVKELRLSIRAENYSSLKVNLVGQQLGIMRGHRCSLGIEFIHVLSKNTKKGIIPKYWDGHTAERIVEIFREK